MGPKTIFNVFSGRLTYRISRLYNTFYHAQYTNKLALVFVLPGFLSFIRYRAETQLGYYVFINDSSLFPPLNTPSWLPKWFNKFFQWKQGTKIYLTDTATVQDLKHTVYKNSIPDSVLVGCHGRLFQDTDTIAIAVRVFCKRDPRVLIWKDEIV